MSLTAEEKDSIISEINERATELRGLIITIGSIIALMIPAVEYLGIIDLASMLDEQTDEIIETCNVDYEFQIEFYVVEDTINTFAEAIDANNCGENHIVDMEINLWKNETSFQAEQQGNLKNSLSFDAVFEEVPVGWWTITFTVINEVDVWQTETYAEVLSEEEQEEEVYGCSDPSALNYDEEVTLDDGSCQYEEPVEQECGENNSAFFYELVTGWSNNSSAWQTVFDVDTDCYDYSMDVGVFISLEHSNGTNDIDMIWIVTTGSDWDYKYINISFEKEPDIKTVTIILFNPDGSEYQREVRTNG